MIEKAREIWQLLLTNPEHRKRFLQKVRYLYRRDIDAIMLENLRNERQHTAPTIAEKPDSLPQDLRLTLLEGEARACRNATARTLCQKALQAADRHSKIRLFKRAIKAERDEEISANAVRETPAPTETEAVPERGIKFLQLNQLTEEKFQIANLVPPSVDATMVKEILLALLDLGSTHRRFQSAYRPVTRLKQRVIIRYATWTGERFNGTTFANTIGWLVRAGVVCKKKKSEAVYSLWANTSEAKSETARVLIAAVLKLDREVRNGG